MFNNILGMVNRHSIMLLFLLPVLLSMISSTVCDCPPVESIAPACICKDLGDGPMMMCTNLMSAEELISPIKATDFLNMFALSIIDSSLLYIPSRIFVNTKFEKIRFANSQIMSLSDGDLAFEGLEDTLEEIRATDAHYITQWDWSQLRNHRRLKLIDIHLIAMFSLDQQFPPLKTLVSLGISKAEISFIHPEAFSELENLDLLTLKDNEISELSRSMFPSPANHLRVLDLSGNHLTSLPNDMFTDMPGLKELELNDNRFVTLDEDTFRWPFENLRLLMLQGNSIRCDCRLRWLVSTHKPMYFKGYCSQPENLKDLPLENIADSVLWCI